MTIQRSDGLLIKGAAGPADEAERCSTRLQY